MNNAIRDQSIKSKRHHSTLGIIATILSFTPVLIYLLIVNVRLFLEKSKVYDADVDGIGNFIALLLSVFGTGIFIYILGIVLSIIGLKQKQKKKLFALIGIILNVIMLLVFLVLGKKFIIG